MRADNVVILSGGLGVRFGGNKLLFRVHGEEIIKRVSRTATQIADSVILSVRNEEMGELLRKVTGLDYITDLELPCSGPVRGLLSAVKRCSTLLIPGDLPWIDSKTLESFLEVCSMLGTAQICGLIWSSESRELESMVVLINSLEPIHYVRRSCELKTTRITDLHRSASSLSLVSAGVLPEPWRLLDIDVPEDLFNTKGSWRKEAIVIRQEVWGNPYRRAIDELEAGNLEEAREMFKLELPIYGDVVNLRYHILKDMRSIGGV